MQGFDRRTFLVASTLGLAGTQLSTRLDGAPATANQRHGKSAKSTILFFLCTETIADMLEDMGQR